MANSIFRIKHGLDVADGELSVAAGTGVTTIAKALSASSEVRVADKLTVASNGADITGDLIARNDLTVTGNLTVNGTTTTVDTTNLVVKDNLIGLNEGATSNALDSGFIIERGSTGDNAILMWDESEDKWTLGTGTATPDESGNLSNFTAGTLVVNTVEGALAGNATTATSLAASRNFSITGGGITAGAQSFDGSGNVVLNASIDADAVVTSKILDANVTFAKIQNLSTMTVLGRTAAGSGVSSEISIDSDMAGGVSENHDSLASAKTIKAYVDAQLSGSNSIQEQTDVLITGTLANGEFLIWDATAETTGRFENKAMSGDITMDKDGVTTIGATKVTNGMLEGSIANGKLLHSTISGVSLGGNLADLTVDDSSIQLASGTTYNGSAAATISVKDGGITNDMLGGSIAAGKLAGSIPDSKLNQITTGNKVAGSAVQLAGTSALEDSTGLQLKAATAGDGLAMNSQVLSVNVDDLSIETNSDTLRIKDDGVTTAKILDANVTNAKLAGSITADKMNNAIFADLETLGAPSADGEFIVATGAGAFAYESGNTVRGSMGLGTGDSPQFTNLTLSGNLTVNGAQVQIDGTTVQMDDTLMEMGLVGKAAPASATTKDLGLLLHRHDGSSASKVSMFWDESEDKFQFQTGVTETDGVLSGGAGATVVASTFEGALSGNATTATALAASRDFSISGDLTAAAVGFTGAGDVALSATIDANAVTLAKMAQLADMKVIGNVSGGAADPAAISIDDDMAGGVSANHDTLASAKTIKAYVDDTVAAATTVSALSDTNVTAPADGALLFYDTGTSKWIDNVVSGDITIADTGVAAIGSEKVTNGMLAGSIANAKLLNSTISGVELGLNLNDLTVDDSSLQLNSGTTFNGGAGKTISVKDGGITNDMLGGSIAAGKLAGSIPDSKLNQITTGDKVAGSAVQLAGTSALEDSTGLQLKSALAGDGLAMDSQVLSVRVDDSTIETNTDVLRIKDDGVTTAKILDANVTNAKLANSTISGVSLGGTLAALTDGNGIADFSYDGSGAASLAIELESANALEVGASGLDLKDTIAGARTFSAKTTHSAGIDVGVAEMHSVDVSALNGTANEVVDSFAYGLHRSAKYVVQVTSGSDYQTSELIVIHDGTTASVSEYGLLFTNASLATFDVGMDTENGNLELKASSHAAGTTMKIVRTMLNA